MKKIYTYKVFCPECKTYRELQTKPKTPTTICRGCNSSRHAAELSQKNRKNDEEKKSYYYFCATCPSIRVSKITNGGSHCGDCSRKFRGSPIKTIAYLEEKKKPKIKEVRVLVAKPKIKPKAVVKKPRVKAPKKYTQVGMDGFQKVTIAVKKVQPIQKKSEDEMMEEFLKNNKVTVIEPLYRGDIY